MSRLTPVLQEQKPWVIPYITAGYPHLSETVDLMQALAQGGADTIELGLPFSDPLADGPVIQETSQKALLAGVTHTKILEMVRVFRKTSQTPIILMGYMNPILAYGTERFFRDAAQAGADGLIIPDLPVDEAAPYLEPARQAGLAWVFLAAPTSDSERLARVDEASDVWSYCVSVTGVTGARDAFPQSLDRYLERVQRVAKKPFVVGFGISRGEHVERVCPPARGVVVGSALLRALSQETTAANRTRCAERFVASIRPRS